MGENKKGFALTFDENTIPIIEQMTEGMPGGFFIYHADGDEELIYINSAVLRIFGCEDIDEFKQLTGYTFKGMVYAEDIDRVESSISQQIKSSVYDLDYVEYRIVQKDGTIRWIEDYGHFIHTDTYGDIFYVFIEDATERMKRRMDELEEMNCELRDTYARESQYKKAILCNADVFLEINLSKDEFINASIQMEDGQIYNLFEHMQIEPYEKYSEYVKYLTKSMEEDAAEEFLKFCDVERLVRCYCNGELEQTLDAWMSDRQGRRRLYHYTFLLGKNEYTGDIITLSIAKDMTEQNERKNLLQSALQQAQNANIARNAFLFHMSHDIRTPLNAIIGLTELTRTCKDQPDKVEEYMNKISISGEQLLTIVNEALEVTRMESGEARLIESECMLGNLLEDVEKKITPQMDAKSIKFAIYKAQVRHMAIVADYMRICEILNQLLDNALNYTEPGGEVSLTVIETDMNLKNYAKYQFIVEDNGRGISEEFKADLFNPFTRENNTTKSGVLGTGLGLAVVKNLVDMMEGSIEVESKSGCGSKFTVSVMLKLQQDKEKEAEIPQIKLLDEKDLIGKRILLVEDNEINSEIARELLKNQGYIVETANDGRMAVDMVSISEPGYYSLVLMDIQMPVMDGYEATRAIRKLENPVLSQIPIIALSANAFAEDYKKSFESGMNAHFPKPINIDGLHDIIRTTLSKYS